MATTVRVNYYMRVAVVFFLIVVIIGCCPQSLIEYNEHNPPGIFLPIAAQNTIDGRVMFREILCSVTKDRKGDYIDELPCAEVLHNLDEPKSTAPKPFIPAANSKAIKVVLITGIFGECIANYLLPFSDGRYFAGYVPEISGYDYLKKLGYEVEVIITKGRASSEENGILIRDKLQEISNGTTRNIIIVSYSKGTTDVLHALTLFMGHIPQNIRAVVSVTGVVAGTPIADEFTELYDSLLKEVPWSACPPTDGGAVRSLSRDEQFNWLSRHQRQLPKSVKYYSLAAFVPSERINDALKPFNKLLSMVDPPLDYILQRIV